MPWTKVGETAVALPPDDEDPISIPLPGNPQPGDLVIVGRAADTEFNNSDVTIRTPGYVSLAITQGTLPGYGVDFKILVTPLDTVITIDTFDSLIPLAVIIQIWRGVDELDPIDAAPLLATGFAGSPNPPANTSSSPDALRVIFGFVSLAAVADTASAPAGYSDFLAVDTDEISSQFNATAMMASKEETASPLVDDPAPFANADGTEWAAIHVIFRAAEPEPPPVLIAEPGSYSITGSEANLVVTGATSDFFTKVGESVFSIGAGSNKTFQLPGFIEPGDIVLFGRISTPTFDDSPILTPGYEILLETFGGDPNGTLAYKVMGDPVDTEVTVDPFFFIIPQAGLIQVWRGVDPAFPIDGEVIFDSGFGPMPDPPPYTTNAEGALRMIWGFLDDDAVADSVTAPLGYSNVLANDQDSFDTTIMVASRQEARPRTDDPLPFGGDGFDEWFAIHFALRPFVGQRLTAEAGSYSITGSPAEFKATFQFTADPGAYAITGTEFDSAAGFMSAFEPGAYTITGIPIDLRFGTSVIAEPGAYAITGVPIAFERTYVLTAAPGSYVITGNNAVLIGPPWQRPGRPDDDRWVSVSPDGEQTWVVVDEGPIDPWRKV